MTTGENFNAAATPTTAAYVDELALSPAPKELDESQPVPTPKLMISPTQMPEPSLNIYKGDNQVIFNTSPTPATSGQPWNLSGTLLWLLMIVAIATFISGIVYGIKNQTPKKDS